MRIESITLSFTAAFRAAEKGRRADTRAPRPQRFSGCRTLREFLVHNSNS
jgi:hypothetical protein